MQKVEHQNIRISELLSDSLNIRTCNINILPASRRHESPPQYHLGKEAQGGLHSEHAVFRVQMVGI